MYSSPIFITSIALLGLIDIFMLPFMLWSVYRFYTIRMHPEINARYPIIILSQSLFNIFEICIRNQYLIIIGINDHTIPTWISMINECLLLIIPIIILYRTWLTNFDINYALIQKQKDWQILLRDKHDRDGMMNDWYSLHKHTYGDWKWLLKCIMIPLFFTLSLFMIFVMVLFDAYDIQYIYNSILLLFIYIPIIYIYIKTPKFADTFFIKQELLLLIKCIICFQVIYTILIYWTYFYMAQIAQIVAIICMNFTQIIISHYWVINQINKNLTEYQSSRSRQSKKMYVINTENTQKLGRKRSHSVEQRILGNRRIFNVIIANTISINYFFSHLMNEFSAENLLGFIEILQWTYDIIGNNFNKYDTSPLGIIKFELAKVVPISSINENKNNNWYIKLKQIHKKYIDSSSEYQINLPYHIQNGYLNLFNLYEIKLAMANGTFKPKTQRKTHRKNIGALGSKKWRQSIRKSFNLKDTKNNIKKRQQQTPSIAMIDINLPMTKNERAKSADHKAATVSTTVNINMTSFPKKQPDFLMASNTADNIVIQHKKGTFSTLIPNTDTILQRHNTFVVHETVDSNSMDSSDEEQNEEPHAITELGLNDIMKPRNTETVMNNIFEEVMDGDENKNDNVGLGVIDEKEIPESNLNYLTTTNSTNMFSRISGLFEFSSVIVHRDTTNHIDFGIDREMLIEEKNKMEKAKKLNLNDFVSLTCNAIHVILQLNHQSVARFKKTKEWNEFQKQVNWQELLMKYGDKGCIPKKMAKLLS